ncbi:M48 family metalloprotease [Trichocoleus sp. FACHB-90]|uniref:zinc metalloprotease HtpX n=1 Tax=Cyanophyceae TaxID=3028117 RepID=UPI0016893364|nr:zinc metalloprotease HtpX [Trichocoleus sp. FACHB-90]MBD1928485.1 M48 family metalloprotease [Trichocoleus sp. FACHB-90]
MASLPDPSLDDGLTALKQGNYQDAIAHLEGVCEVDLSSKSVVRAQMGLVVAYERTGKIEKARSLCVALSQSKYPKVKSWAEPIKAKLDQRYPQAPPKSEPSPETADVTGFAPLNETTPALEPPPKSEPSPETADVTGFAPLNETTPALEPPPASDVTGFVPLNETPPPQTRTGTGSNIADVPFQTTATATPTDTSQPDKKDVSAPVQKAVKGNTQAESPRSPSRSDGNENKPLLAAAISETSVTDNTSKDADELPVEQTRSPASLQWKQAGRAQGWKAMKAVQQERLWLLQAGVAIALFWAISLLLQFVMTATNNFLLNIPFLQPIQAFYEQPTGVVVIVLLLLACLSPWILDLILKHFYGIQPLSLSTLSKFSPEAAKMLPRYCGQKRLKLPTLKILPSSAPVALTYGNLPQTARIVVSQGLLDQLADEEIAAIYAGELGHIVQNRLVGIAIAFGMFLIGGFFYLLGSDWAFNCWWIALACLPLGANLAVISLVVLVAQLAYIVYWQVARWGDRTQSPVLKIPAAVISALSYGLFWLTRALGLWLSRSRFNYSDRVATDITGNPNGLTRALLKIAIGIAADVQQHQSTSWLLESFDLLMPVGHRQAIALGSVTPLTSFESVLQWDCLNPSRQWMTINNSHPLIGDRLYLISLYARHWKLETELNFTQIPSLKTPKTKLRTPNSKLLLQGAPFFGILFGLALGCLFWLLGWIGSFFGIRQLVWMLDDYWTILLGCLPIGFGLGTFLRINAFFPDIKPGNLQDPNLPKLYASTATLPVDSKPVRMQGKLLGRRGMSNWLGQDLILQTDTGLIKLHPCSQLGPIGNLLPSSRPGDLVNLPVTAIGWFRRGATPWIDLETLRSQSGITTRSYHPIWSTILACAAAAWGIYIIWRG